MDAQTLFHDGVAAIRERRDLDAGRDLILRSLKLEPRNDMAWLWLTHTTTDPAKQRDYVARALAINPANPHALDLQARLSALAPGIRSLKPAPSDAGHHERITRLLDEADALQASGDVEGAIGRWVEVLKLQPDHEIAIRDAVGHLWRLGYPEDAKELVGRALLSGTTVPSILLTALDIAQREQDEIAAARLRARIAAQPSVKEDAILALADRYQRDQRFELAADFLARALAARPDSQPILVRLGELYEAFGQPDRARGYYERAVALSPGTKAGRAADERLLAFGPALGRRERQSVALAVREAVGIVLVYLLLAWQDAGLSLLAMTPAHWGGVLLALVGGYLAVTAASSPQQGPLAAWLSAPSPPSASPSRTIRPLRPDAAPPAAERALPVMAPTVRVLLGAAGVLLLVLALTLVLGHSIDLALDYTPPPIPVF